MRIDQHKLSCCRTERLGSLHRPKGGLQLGGRSQDKCLHPKERVDDPSHMVFRLSRRYFVAITHTCRKKGFLPSMGAECQSIRVASRDGNDQLTHLIISVIRSTHTLLVSSIWTKWPSVFKSFTFPASTSMEKLGPYSGQNLCSGTAVSGSTFLPNWKL